MIDLTRETFEAVRGEIAPLWRAHYAEIAQDKDAIPLDPDVEKYASLEQGGHLVIVTARKAGVLVGYVFAVADRHLHYRSTIFAMLDLHYLAPDCRGGRTFARMMIEIEHILAGLGVVKVIGNTKLAHDQGRLFEALGWREAERIFVKLLRSE